MQSKYLTKFIYISLYNIYFLAKKKKLRLGKKAAKKGKKISIFLFIRRKLKLFLLSLWKIKLVLWAGMTMNCGKYHTLYNIVVYMFVIWK